MLPVLGTWVGRVSISFLTYLHLLSAGGRVRPPRGRDLLQGGLRAAGEVRGQQQHPPQARQDQDGDRRLPGHRQRYRARG